MDPIKESKQIQQTWDQLLEAVSVEQNLSAATLGLYLLLGGLIALYLRFLFRMCAVSANDSESITRIFP